MIRNLVFDVGGVLLEYRWQDMFRQQGLSEEEIGKLEQVLFRDEIWHGNWTPEPSPWRRPLWNSGKKGCHIRRK